MDTSSITNGLSSGWLNIATAIIVFGLTMFNVLNQKRADQRAVLDKADERLVTLLKATVEALETKVKELEQRFTETLVELTRIRTERDTLASILQGRDERSAEMSKAAQVAMQNVQTVLETVRRIEASQLARTNSRQQQ